MQDYKSLRAAVMI